MKKSLIALAVLAASGVATAQSSVTMYGVVDVGLSHTSSGSPSSTQMAASTLLNNGTSRLGVRGVEDLGGGMKASFNFEQGINVENGGTAARGFDRAAWLALSGGFGQLTMGRQLTPSFWGVATWELTGTANYSAVGTQFGYAVGSNTAANGNPRNDSMFAYTTPKMGGFSATLGYATKDDQTIAGLNRGAKVDMNVIYANGPLGVGLSYNKVSDLKGNAVLGARYDFGGFKLAGSFQGGYTGTTPGAQVKQNGFTIGGSVPVGPVSLTLDIARDTSAKDTDFLLEAKYALSKRTFAYAVYYKDGDKKRRMAGENNLGLGVRHNF